ncbi:hypothetical protein CKAN_02763300 [Cinnamomum micranthum f. kanehirae]|uniref:Uncharacterized protein n=1 Tax=Cinnamomum micranthum f. kanehirae TaxID=337451 RepID=A0A443Q527_9MAGN|nr:hypothetical protein CKAN_02763300 [Cinnamomum micranthum f. kanehirae]
MGSLAFLYLCDDTTRQVLVPAVSLPRSVPDSCEPGALLLDWRRCLPEPVKRPSFSVSGSCSPSHICDMRQPAHRLYNGESLYISGVVGVAGARGDRHVPLAVGRKGESTWPPRSWEGAGAEVGVSVYLSFIHAGVDGHARSP